MDNLEKYREAVLDHFENPKNSGLLDDYDFYGKGENKSCNDTVEITLKFVNRVVEDVGVKSDGCVISRSFSSFFSEAVKGLSRKELRELDENGFFDLIGFKPRESRLKCALTCFYAVENI